MRTARLCGWLLAVAFALPVSAQDARLLPELSSITDNGTAIEITLALTMGAAFRTRVMGDPPRLIVDLNAGLAPLAALPASQNPRLRDLRMGAAEPGWTRLVAVLDRPYRLVEAQLDSATAKVHIRMEPVSAAEFTALLAAQPDTGWHGPVPAAVATPKRRQTGDAPLVVVLDPGHGGIDPGADGGTASEAALMLAFAKELAKALTAAGMHVVLTRTGDTFVPLETRISIARAAGADVLLSLHADALAEGVAVGATIYAQSSEASDEAVALLAERHDRTDLLLGVDLSGQDDAVASVLMEMAQAETAPRAARLALTLVSSIAAAGGKMHRHPIQSGAFSVLKAPDIPSLLLELGFLSSPNDLKRLNDPAWRAMMQGAIVQALQNWATADALEAKLLRQ